MAFKWLRSIVFLLIDAKYKELLENLCKTRDNANAAGFYDVRFIESHLDVHVSHIFCIGSWVNVASLKQGTI